MNKRHFYVIFLILILGIVFLFLPKIFIRKDNFFATVKIGGSIIYTEIADTPIKRYQGLSGRNSLKKNNGMLFIFSTYERPAFVMRDMKFSIDIVWIKDNAVVDITENLPLPAPSANLPVFMPKELINYALEVPTGFSKQKKITIGDRVEFHNLSIY